ncbi:sugar nucleotide-binding protein [Anaerosporobacter faecicola]|uniref:sugar nucleotide-binding protein n=1 Tax=Anaerosporobacter faecicola TaxID=2718714 RepID=UPI00143A6118|nr:sugar nucleotide-binding protein [Anaerosporobacter faecicola]
MRILVFGSSGYAGQKIKSRLAQEYKYVFGTYHNSVSEFELEDATMYSFDLRSLGSLTNLLLETKPTVIIYCLRGDFAQQLSAVRVMAQYIQEKETGKMVFLSTSNVFDGALSAPHYEDEPPKADTDYGKFKIECENILQTTIMNKSVILRIPQIYGKNCPRLNRLKEASSNGETLNTIKNLFVNYTTDEYIADWILYILKNNLTGVFHIGSEDIIDYYAFQVMLLNALKIPAPLFSIEEEKEASYQAVLPHRNDIPDWLKFKVVDVIHQMMPL